MRPPQEAGGGLSSAHLQQRRDVGLAVEDDAAQQVGTQLAVDARLRQPVLLQRAGGVPFD